MNNFDGYEQVAKRIANIRFDSGKSGQHVKRESVGVYGKKLHIPQELRIRSRGTERHSALNRAKLSTFISYHYLLCDPCQEIQDDMPWMSFGLSKHLHRWNLQKVDTIRILESVR